MAEKRTYEVVIIIDPTANDEAVTGLTGNLQQTIERQGATIVKSEDMGRRRLAYEIENRTEGHYWLYEIDGTGSEIAELERRMRVNDLVVRYLTVRVDLDRRRADKFKTKRQRRASNRRRGGQSVNSNSNSNNNNQSEFAMEDAAAIES